MILFIYFMRFDQLWYAANAVVHMLQIRLKTLYLFEEALYLFGEALYLFWQGVYLFGEELVFFRELIAGSWVFEVGLILFFVVWVLFSGEDLVEFSFFLF